MVAGSLRDPGRNRGRAFQRGMLTGDQAQDDGLVVWAVGQRLESAGSLVVVLEEEDLEVRQPAEHLTGDARVSSRRRVMAAYVAAAQMNPEGDPANARRDHV